MQALSHHHTHPTPRAPIAPLLFLQATHLLYSILCDVLARASGSISPVCGFAAGDTPRSCKAVSSPRELAEFFAHKCGHRTKTRAQTRSSTKIHARSVVIPRKTPRIDHLRAHKNGRCA
ncbi:MAG: hypothetical protein VYC34_11395, partial [Planctomycetota bacterium]|nr:hypothetical protein [Planctomycetota bacterium]